MALEYIRCISSDVPSFPPVHEREQVSSLAVLLHGVLLGTLTVPEARHIH